MSLINAIKTALEVLESGAKMTEREENVYGLLITGMRKDAEELARVGSNGDLPDADELEPVAREFIRNHPGATMNDLRHHLRIGYLRAKTLFEEITK